MAEKTGMQFSEALFDRRRIGAIAVGAVVLAVLAGHRPASAAVPPPGPQTYFLLVLSDPVPGNDKAYSQWFAEPHLRDMASVPGVVTVQHFVDARLELRHAPMKTPHDLVLYTIVTDRLDAVKDAIARRAESGRAWPGPALASVRTYTYRAFRPPMQGAGGEPADTHGDEKKTYLVVAFGDALAGQDDAFNSWYDTVHEPELVSNPGVVSGQRAVLSEVQLGPPGGQSHYLMMQTIVTRDLPAVFHGILQGGPPSPAMDRTRGFGFTYRLLGPGGRSDQAR